VRTAQEWRGGPVDRFHFQLFQNTINIYAIKVIDTQCMLHWRTASVRRCSVHCSKYGVLLSNSFPLSLPVGSFIVLAQPAGHRRNEMAVRNNKRQMSDKMWKAALSHRINTASISSQTGSKRSVLILLASCLQQTCMTYTIAVCTVKNSWWWTEELSETCRVSFQE